MNNKQWIEQAPKGWMNIILKADEMLSFIDPEYKIDQIKEKFGGLRYYFSTTKSGVEREIMYIITRFAQGRSFDICMDCGKYGELRHKPYVVTLCDACNEEQEKRDKAFRKLRK